MPDIRTTGQIDDFERPDEHPVVDPPWAQLDYSGAWNNNHIHGGILANPTGYPYNDSIGYATAITWSYWSPSTNIGDFEAWGRRFGGEAGAAGTGWRIGFWRNSTVGSAGAASGYLCLWFTAVGDTTQIRKYTSASSWTNVGTSGGSFGAYLYFRKIGATLEGWHSNDLVTWNMTASATMDDYVDEPFNIGFGVEDPTGAGTGWASVGGGRKEFSQIYRRIHN